ncbi:MAG: hypothetical protein GY793_08330 [Proteobacteria bacterium]|nr:hypothetical protein [Pseudomonadota bacterium]
MGSTGLPLISFADGFVLFPLDPPFLIPFAESQNINEFMKKCSFNIGFLFVIDVSLYKSALKSENTTRSSQPTKSSAPVLKINFPDSFIAFLVFILTVKGCSSGIQSLSPLTSLLNSKPNIFAILTMYSNLKIFLGTSIFLTNKSPFVGSGFHLVTSSSIV